jgi:glycosyltransferase involved in cell wall biosynthesis
MSGPSVSVITVCFQALDDLRMTVPSVLSQTCQDFEYIVIDGASRDGSLEYVQGFGQKIQKVISERDNGIYDAMNKGVSIATGCWVLFMNAGDRFYSTDSLKRVVKELKSTQTDLLYGGCEIRYPNGLSRIQKPGHLKDLWKGMPCSHQSLLARRELLIRFPFDTENRITADYQFFLSVYCLGSKIIGTGDIVSSISAGGVSDRKRVSAVIGHWKLSAKAFSNWKAFPWHTYRLIRAAIFIGLKKILPGWIFNRLHRWRHSLLRDQ